MKIPDAADLGDKPIFYQPLIRQPPCDSFFPAAAIDRDRRPINGSWFLAQSINRLTQEKKEIAAVGQVSKPDRNSRH